MLAVPFKMNSMDISAYIQKDGVSTTYVYRKGLPDKYTMDGKKHTDMGTNKRIVTIRFNPQSEDVVDQIINEYRSGLIFVTHNTEMFLCEPVSQATKSAALTVAGEVTAYQVSPLTFEEL
jgi:hypothetical protein